MEANRKSRRQSGIRIFGGLVVIAGMRVFWTSNWQFGTTIVGFGLTYIFLADLIAEKR